MDIAFNCDHCGQSIVVEEAGAGLVAQCPKCGQSLRVPSAAAGTFPAIPTESPSANSLSDTKECPFCAETIKKTATVCRFCRCDLTTGKPSVGRSQLPILRTVAVLLLLAIFAGGYSSYIFWKDRKAKNEMVAASEKAAEEKKRVDAEAVRAAEKAAEDKRRTDAEAAAKAAEEKKKQEARGRFLASVSEAMVELHALRSALDVGISYNDYSPKILVLSAKRDECLRVARETELYDSNTFVSALCDKVQAISVDYIEARDEWGLEFRCREEANQAQLEFHSRLHGAASSGTGEKLFEETKSKITEAAEKEKAALRAKLNKWADALKQIDEADAMIVSLKKQFSD
jgi:hypothetical protein